MNFLLFLKKTMSAHVLAIYGFMLLSYTKFILVKFF